MVTSLMMVWVSSITSTPSGSQIFRSPMKPLTSMVTSSDSKLASRRSSLTVPSTGLTLSWGATTQEPLRSLVLSSARIWLLP